MSYLILGIGLLAGLLLAGKWFVSAEPKTLARVLKWVLFAVVGIVALFFILSGRFIWVLWLLPVLLPWIMRLRAAATTVKNYSRVSSRGGSGQGSTVMSEYLEMHLDHDSGDMDGIIRKSTHEGARLSDLSAEQLAALYDEYAVKDGESARLLAAFLDRMYPEWRRQGADEGGDAFTESAGNMSRSEAFRILGLGDDADDAEIKAAHHRLIAGLHPDRGGSAYLAAKINEARDVLLKS